MKEFSMKTLAVSMTVIPAAILVLCFSGAPAQSEMAVAQPRAESVARGKYLVIVAGCNDCHTPLKAGPNGPEPDVSRMLSGHPESLSMPPSPPLPAQGPWGVTVSATNTAWSGPWGVSFTANLTPDPDTGLGRWTPRNFKDTIRSGRHLSRGRPILPPMPVAMYKQMTDEDLDAVFAYLQSIPPVSNRVPQPWPAVSPAATQR
jgi:mono/diheme cytochrome c family protein